MINMEDLSKNPNQYNEPAQAPGQPEKKPGGQNLGVAALITAIITFVFAVIPCVGLMAVIPGIIAIVLASVGLSQAAKNDSPRGILVAGLIIGIVATLISFSQIFVAGEIATVSPPADAAPLTAAWGSPVQPPVNKTHPSFATSLPSVYAFAPSDESRGVDADPSTAILNALSKIETSFLGEISYLTGFFRHRTKVWS